MAWTILGLTGPFSSPILRFRLVLPRAILSVDNLRSVSREGEASMVPNEQKEVAFEIKERRVGEVTILELKGRVALGKGSQALHDKLQALIDQGCLKLLLECSGVTTLDSQGISSLVRGVISTRKRGGQLKLLKPSPRAHHVLDTTRLLTVIESFDDEAKALASF